MNSLAARSAVVLASFSALFTVGSSLIFLYGTGLISQFNYPGYQWWLYAACCYDRPAVHSWLLASGIPTFIILLILTVRFLWPRQIAAPTLHKAASVPKRSFLGGGPSTPVRSGTDNLGHARWATQAENEYRWPFLGPGPNRLIVGEAYNPLEETGPYEPYNRATWGKGGKAPKHIDDGRVGSTHSMGITGSGGGKSMMIVSNLLTWTGPCVCFDPAAELGPMVKRAREAMGRRVVILDPDHARVCGINGCGWIKPSSPMAEIDVAAQVEWVCGRTAKGDGGGNDSSVFFKNRGKAIVTAVLAHLIWDPALPPKLKTLNTMRQLLAVPEKDVKTLLGNIHQTSHSRLARQLAGSFSGTAAEDTFSGVCQSAEEDTRWLSVEAYGDLVSGDALQTSDLLRGDTDVFLSLPLKSMHDTPRVARVILGALLNELYDANGNIPNRVLFEIDEAWMLQQFEPLEIARPAGRKYGVTIQMWYQSVSQIEQQWGIRGAKAWFNDVSWYAFSGLNELQAAREVSEGIGEYGVVRRSESENTGKSGRGLQFGSRSRGRSVTYSEAARRVLQSAEILRDLRADALLVLPRSGKAALLGQCAHYRRDEWRDLVDDNRFAKLPGGKYARP